MATLAAASHHLVQVVLPGKSGLPRDRYVNTLHFARETTTTPTETDYEELAQKVEDLYHLTVSTFGAIDGLLSPVAIDAAAASMNIYRMADAEPRIPVVEPLTITLTGSDGLPNELAVCGSFYSGSNQPSRRGRLYFGPLRYAATFLEGDTEIGDVRPAAVVSNIIAGALERLGTESGTWFWCQYSKKLDRLLQPTHVYCDNAFDIQRRRGVDPTARALLTVS